MGSTNYLSKSRNGFRAKSGSSIGSDKDTNGKIRRSKIRRPGKMPEYGMKRIPDYTELAYKEAVSKLRYFLSGNYAPSIRSYGSPSIKNLDESDLDTDKKYGTVAYPSALTEYKPRPRLTTKYATLYADSLKNYNPAPTLTSATPAPAPLAADITGGTNPDVVHFIQKQEEYIEQLERESQYCRDELNNLLGKVKEVISENEHLHEAQKNKLISRMFHSYNTAESETDDLDDIGDSTGLDSDSKPIPLKSKRATKTRSTRLEGPNIVFESRISELEAQLAQSKIDLKKVQEENNENKRKLANGLVDSTYLDGFKRQIDNLQRDKNSLESQISKLKLSLEQKDGDLDLKYKRGIDDSEHLREERNNLEAEVRRMKDELANERGKIRELAGEGARRVIQERSAAEQRYTAHFDELAHDLAAQYDNVAKLQLDLERQRREENDLKRELSSKNTIIEELRMELKNKSSNLQSDLSHAHAEKASIEEELSNARLALERQQRQSKHETNRLNSEIQSLRQRLDRADADLVHSRRENLRLSEQIAALEKELNMKNLTPLSPEKNKKEKELSTVLESMENKHAKTVAELESMIHSQNDLMEKLTGECRLLTDKLDDVNRRHKVEKTQLICRNSELMRKLRSLWSSHKKYCTTSALPLRSYSPLSGYPYSRSSYSEFDRTLSTSTPYKNKYSQSLYKSLDSYRKFGTSKSSDDVNNISGHFSNLSIDKIIDYDDDLQKPKLPVNKRDLRIGIKLEDEMANLQRKVENLGQSLQQPADHTPISSNYEAPTSHSTTSFRNNDAPSYPGQDDPRLDTTRHPQISRQPSNSNIGGNTLYSNNPDIPDQLTINADESQEQHSNLNSDGTFNKVENAVSNNEAAIVDDTQLNAHYEAQPNYDNTQGYVQDPNYTQDYSVENQEYQGQYDQQYDPTQYDGNYEQYPPQEPQVYDNNGEYANYAAEPNEGYTGEQPVYEPQYSEEPKNNAENQPNEMVFNEDKQRTTSPKELPYQR